MLGYQSQPQVLGSKQVDTIISYTSPGNTPASPQSYSSVFTHPGSAPYSSFANTNVQPKSMLLFGYMIGFSYALNQRFLFDLAVQQNITNVTNLPDQNLKDVYMQPYFRLTVGYKLYIGRKREE
jgi:hypothetical protein